VLRLNDRSLGRSAAPRRDVRISSTRIMSASRRQARDPVATGERIDIGAEADRTLTRFRPGTFSRNGKWGWVDTAGQ